ncbi:unnamed protein product [Mytilus edulis]|uniref:Uncharacterized protein n=1 Tax=Mytilus edulis TaxID=6550 RepID=A0A8S3V602_MYTED|nr:unnamed protein product [Mytilus edulis]
MNASFGQQSAVNARRLALKLSLYVLIHVIQFGAGVVSWGMDCDYEPPIGVRYATVFIGATGDIGQLFARKQRQYDTIRPTRAALLDHTKLATYRGGHVWGQAVTHDQHLPSPGDWEWVKENADGMWIPHWTQLAAIAASCQELHKCGCKKTCSGNCKCYKAGLTCTTLCSCSC